MTEPTRARNRGRRILLAAVKIAIAAVLLTLLLRGMKWADFRAAFWAIRWGWFVAAVALHFPGYVISAWRWGILLRAQGQHIPFRRLLESYLVATFFNYTLLGTLGGDFVRMYHTGLGQKRGAQAASAVLVERLTGLATMILLAALGMALLALWRGEAAEGATATMHWLVWGAAALFVLFCAALSLLTHPRVVGWLAGLLDRPWPLFGAVRRALLKLHEALAVFRGNPRPVYVNLAWALLLQINVAAHYFCLGLAMAPAALMAAPLRHALSYIVLVPIVTLILMIPVTPGGVGIREWTLSRPVVRSGLGFSATSAGAANAVLLGWLQVASVLIYGGVGLVLFLTRSLRLRGNGATRL